MEIEKQQPIKLAFDPQPNDIQADEEHFQAQILCAYDQNLEQYSDEASDLHIEECKFKVPKLIYENSEAILRFSALNTKSNGPTLYLISHYLVNKLMGLLRIVKRETKILTKIRNMLSSSEGSKYQLFDGFSTPSTHVVRSRSTRVSMKTAHLMRVYEQIHNHRAFLLDYVILYLSTMIDNFRLLDDLDYRRLLYTSRQIAKCKQILLSSVKSDNISTSNRFIIVRKPGNNTYSLHSGIPTYPVENQYNRLTHSQILQDLHETHILTNNLHMYNENSQEGNLINGDYSQQMAISSQFLLSENALKRIKF